MGQAAELYYSRITGVATQKKCGVEYETDSLIFSALVQTGIAQNSNGYFENIKFFVGFGAGKGSNVAGQLRFNLKAQISIKQNHNIGLIYSQGDEFFIGVESPRYNKHELNDLEDHRAVGLLYIYEFSLTRTGPYFGAGVSYLNGKDRSDRKIIRIGVPLEFGLNVNIFRRFSLGIGYLGNWNTYSRINGITFRFGIQ